MPGRSYIGPSGYRYGFGTQEKDDEIYGNGNSYTAEYWQYDSRLGRRWNIDPITYEWQSPFATFNNNPVYYSDPSGLEGEKKDPNNKHDDNGDGVSTSEEGCGSSNSETGMPSFNGKTGPWSTDYMSNIIKMNERIADIERKLNTPQTGNTGSKTTLLMGNHMFPDYNRDATNHNVAILPFDGGTQQYYNTTITGLDRISEPDYFIQFLFSNKGIFDEVGYTQFKQKMAAFENGFKPEAPTATELTFSKNITPNNFSKGNTKLSVLYSFGLTWANLFYDNVDGIVDPVPMSFMGYRLYGYSSTIMLKVDLKITKKISIFTAVNLHHLRSIDISVNQGMTEPARSFTSGSILGGFGYVFP